MRRSSLITLIDILSFIGFVFLTSTGVLMRYVLPPGSGRWSSVWGLSRHDWGTIHYWIALGFFAVLAAHLVLHWRFVAGLFGAHLRAGARLRLALGIVGLVAVLALAAAPVLTPAESSGASSGGGRHGVRPAQ